MEGLARVDVLCIDKTGTLTEGRLAVDPRRAARTGPTPLRRSPRSPQPTRRPTRRCGRSREAYPRRLRGLASRRRRPVLVGPEVERGDFGEHGRWVLGAPDVLLRARRRCASTSARRPPPGDGCSCWRGPSALRRGRARRPGTGRGDRAGRSRPRPTPRHARVLRRAGRDGEGPSGDHPATVGAIAASLGLEGADAPVDARTRCSTTSRRSPKRSSEHSVFGRVTPQQKRAMVAGAAGRRAHRRDDRRRGERRPRAEGCRHRGRDGLRLRCDPCRRAARLAGLDLRCAALGGRRGPPRPRQHRTHVGPVPDEDRLRDADRARDGRRRVRVPVPPAAPDADRRADDRHPVVLPGARAEHRAVPSRVRRAGARGSRSPPARSRRSRRSSTYALATDAAGRDAASRPGRPR